MGLVFVLVITTFVHFIVLSGLWMGSKGGVFRQVILETGYDGLWVGYVGGTI